MKKVFKLLFIIFVIFNVTSASAQNATPSPSSTEPVDEVADLKFPIEDLGGCGDYKACLTFCDDPVNNAICVDFAKKNGFYKDDPVLAPTDDFLTKAKDILGCESATACATFCSQSANFDACNAFAKSQGIPGAGYVEDPVKDELLEKAEQSLGCNGADSCVNFCEDAANQDKCDQFADQSGLLGGEIPVGPGGCTTTQTCQAYCSDPANFETCKSFSGGSNFSGPGGCNSPDSCRSFCEENPADCRSYAPGSNGVYVPAVCPSGQDFGPGGVCTATGKLNEAASCAQGGGWWNGSSCAVDNGSVELPVGIHPNVGGAYYQPRPEMGGCSNPGACYDYCKENAGKCPSFNPDSPRPKEGYIPALYYTPGTEVKFTPKADMGNCDSPGSCYDYCKENPGKCGGFDDKSPRPVDTYMPGTYYTPPSDQRYYTPPVTGFYVTPIYFTPPSGSNYTTPSYYTPGTYSTPTYYTPPTGSNYTTPNYYTPGSYYPTPSNGQYPTPSYMTPTYYTPPVLASYTTPSYYTPPAYTSPYYYTPPAGSNYTTPTYNTPPAYTTPTYYTPYTGGNYTTPVYYTPPAGSNYTTPNYPTPSYYYPTPTGGYTTPVYPTPPAGSTYPSPTYYTPGGSYATPASSSYSYPTPGSAGYTYPTPGYNTPSGSQYPTPPSYIYPTPGSSYSYPTPDAYVSPTYYSPSYTTPPPYNTPSYSTPSYSTPAEYPTPAVQGASTGKGLLQTIWDFIQSN